MALNSSAQNEKTNFYLDSVEKTSQRCLPPTTTVITLITALASHHHGSGLSPSP